MGRTEHSQLVRSVLDSHPFDSVLGFASASVIPNVVGPFIARFCVLCAEYPHQDIVTLALQASSLKSILTSTPVVVIHRPDPAGPIVSTRIVYSVEYDICWGIAHHCPQCKSGPPYITCNPHRRHQKGHQRFEKPEWVKIHEDYVVEAFDEWLKPPGHTEVRAKYQSTVRGRAPAKILDWLSREENKDHNPPEELYPDNATLQQSDAESGLLAPNRGALPREIRLSSNSTMSTTYGLKRTAREFGHTPPTLDDAQTAAARESGRPPQRRRFNGPRRFSVERGNPRDFANVSPPPPDIILPY
ncbi:hypothetical protein HETIRDRAFT_100315 [Heterobasidion irregulare TC 32-1]|uniref:Uncharacterized protein n=1 Tax=Heterobasidion irregulare (strain TC 32-1) TaxID=747525 RepID=W4KLB9_HETIT|nr:uncharacterized protein HETIRDRAFT_100315 [Heterobasidion irregulare TC 32-1]ETW86155.1 hypothetical protein HETIRDRAFT_100315 [Heterobasidion irregulare TC 32-1]